MVKRKQWNTVTLTRQDYKNSIRENHQKKKKRKNNNMKRIDIRACLMRKNKNEKNI